MTGARWVLGLVLALGACRDHSKPAPAEQEQLVPLEETPLGKDLAAGRCATLVDQLVAQPRWSLGIEDWQWEDTGEGPHRRSQVEQDGTVHVEHLGLVRTLKLEPDELAALAALGSLDCAATEEDHHGSRVVQLSARTPGDFAKDSEASILAETDASSALGAKVLALLDAANARRTAQELARLDPITFHLESTLGGTSTTFDLAGDTLRVFEDGAKTRELQLDAQQRLDLVEQLGLPADTQDGGYAAGTLTAGGATTKVYVSLASPAYYTIHTL